jgi:hypothetical protein
MEPDKVTQAEGPQSAESREFERLRETIGVLREKLEACRRHEEAQIQARRTRLVNSKRPYGLCGKRWRWRIEPLTKLCKT